MAKKMKEGKLQRGALFSGFHVAPIASSLSVLMACGVLFSYTPLTTAQESPAGLQPHATLGWSNANISSSNATSMTIQQTQAKAILNWQKLNLNSGESLRFLQNNSSWVALNRIYDTDPSRIAGNISALGQVYLINQNGIIFDKGAQINVHTLIASTLNITDAAFQGGIPTQANSTPFFDGLTNSLSSIKIVEGAAINTAPGGSVMIFAPYVENNGVITTPDGQAILAAGQTAYLAYNKSEDASMRGVLVEVKAGEGPINLTNLVVNNGSITADRGNVTLAGLAVNQNGLISAKSSVRLNGSIWLQARQTSGALAGPTEDQPYVTTSHGTVTLGKNSITETPLDLDDKTTIADGQSYQRSVIKIEGKKIEHQGKIISPSGIVMLNAMDAENKPLPGEHNQSRIYLAEDSSIDVSGTWTELAMEKNLLEVDMRGGVFESSPLQRGGILQGKKVAIDIRKGTPLTDITDLTKSVQRSVSEKAASGGNIKLTSEGDIIVRENALLDVSGGGYHFNAGYLNTTKLISEGKIYDIGTAPLDKKYDEVLGYFSVDHNKWGVTEKFYPVSSNYQEAYTEGKSAGELQITAAGGTVVDGIFRGNVTRGSLQRDKTNLPQGGRLIIGNPTAVGSTESNQDLKTSDIVFQSGRNPLTEFSSDSELSDERKNKMFVDNSALKASGFSGMAFYSNGKITVPENTNIDVPTGGSIVLIGRNLDINGNINAPSGKIELASKSIVNQGASENNIIIGPQAKLSTRGVWVNNSPAISNESGTEPLLIDGGSITVNSYRDLLFKSGSTADVSGGAWVQKNNKVRGGNAGTITMATNVGNFNNLIATKGILELSGDLKGYAIGKGGKLNLTAPHVTIGGRPIDDTNDLHLSTEFFQRGGFSDYAITGLDGVTVKAGENLTPQVQNLELGSNFKLQASGANMQDFSNPILLPADQRQGTQLSLQSKTLSSGDVVVESGAVIRTDPKGSVALSSKSNIIVEGSIDAPAGKISLLIDAAVGGDGDILGFDPAQSIWLGENSSLSSRGAVVMTANDKGLRQGEVLDAGQITIEAQKGYIVTKAGSKIDVSGTSAELDILQSDSAGSSYQVTSVYGNAGNISLTSREGILLDGTLKGTATDAKAAGGKLSITLDRKAEVNPAVSGAAVPYPTSDRKIILSQSGTGSFLPSDLQPKDMIDTANFNGKAFVAADAVMRGGFDQLALRSENQIEFKSPVSLDIRRNIQLDSPVITASGVGQNNLNASYIYIGNSNTLDPAAQAVQTPTSGTAQLNVQADLVDLVGRVTLRGFNNSEIVSRGDMRASGVAVDTDPDPEKTAYALQGSFNTAGNITLQAAQIYPTTQSDFTFSVQDNPSGTITVLPGATPGAILSAGGKLTMSASQIDHSGVIKAPLGQIVLNATDALNLKAGSLTSVTAAGQIIPYGETSQQQDWFYKAGEDKKIFITAPPQKKIELAAKNIALAENATIDLTGGGDIQAFEFIPGPDGLKDRFLSPNTYAIVPGLKAQAYDTHLNLNSKLAPGDSVYLSGVDGLPAGVYSLLPAQYAMLPGAFVITSVSGYRDIQPGQNISQPNGATIVAGYRAVANTSIRDARWSGFSVRSGSALMTEAKYALSNSDLFTRQATEAQKAIPWLPGDAGNLALIAQQGLVLDANLLTDHATGFKGAELDISADKLAVVTTKEATSDYLQLQAKDLNRLGVESLLLGGSRQQTADGTVVNVGANEVLVKNDAGSALTLPEIILAAKDKVTIKDGSQIQAKGDASGKADDLLIDGDGALLRASVNGQSNIRRTDVEGFLGTLTIEGNTLLSANSLTPDATFDTKLDSQAELSANALSLAAKRISIGDGASDGLMLTGDLLARVQKTKELLLHSYSTIDFRNGTSLGETDIDGKPLLEKLTLEAAGLAGYNNTGKDTVVTAGSITLVNSGKATSSDMPGGDGNLHINAKQIKLEGDTVKVGSGEITIAQGDKSIKGFSNVTINADNKITAQGKGALDVAGTLTIDTPKLTAASGANQAIGASGFDTLIQSSDTAKKDTAYSLAATLKIYGKNVTQNGTIDLSGGHLILQANDNLVLGNNSTTTASGVKKSVGSTEVAVSGGKIELIADNGNIEIKDSAKVDVSASGADAGKIKISAEKGKLTIDGDIKASAETGYGKGVIAVDVNQLDFSAINNKLNEGQFDQRNLRLRNGDVLITATDTVNASNFSLAADDGKIDVAGTINASGQRGGSVALYAKNDLILQAGANIDAHATDEKEKSGQVYVSTINGSIDIKTGLTIDVGSGEITLRAPRTGADAGNGVAITALNGDFKGATSVVVEANKVYSGVSNIGVTGLNPASVIADNASFMANTSVIKAGLGKSADTNFHLHTAVEIIGSGDITLGSDWNLYSAIRPENEPGVLTIRAANNVNLNGSLSDGFNGVAPSSTLQPGNSWSYQIIAGADSTAANRAATLTKIAVSNGNVNLASGKLIRTGTGNIEIAAASNINLGNAATVYSAGTLDGSSERYPANGGNVALTAGRDIKATVSGDQYINDWLRRTTSTNIINLPKDPAGWWVHLNNFKHQIGSFGGGDISLQAAGNIERVSAFNATSAEINVSKQLVVRGGGDLHIEAGKNIIGGDYLVSRGAGTVSAGNDIGDTVKTGLYLMGESNNTELSKASFLVEAGHDINLQNISNPTAMILSTPAGSVSTAPGFQSARSNFFTYAPDSSATLRALTGDIVLNDTVSQGAMVSQSNIYPAQLSVTAIEGNIRSVSRQITMFPSDQNKLQLAAGQNISNVALTISDALGSALPTWDKLIATNLTAAVNFSAGKGFNAGPTTPRRVNISESASPYVITTGEGDIRDSVFSLPGKSSIEAGHDIQNVDFSLQNTTGTDVTSIKTGRDFVYTTEFDSSGAPITRNGIHIGGPGNFLIRAARNINLGSAAGIIASGDRFNTSLPSSQSAHVTVLAGVKKDIPFETINQLFSDIAVFGKTQNWKAVDDAVELALPVADVGTGNLTMYYSTITSEGNSGIDILVPGGNINAGLTSTLDRSEGVGLVTKLGGEIRSYLKGDFVVNESRIMTLQGGDVLIYAQQGNIDAGRGAKTSLTTSPPKRKIDDKGNIVFIPPSDAQGSGIRTLTSDPDGAGPITAPKPGDVFLFAPKGTINAGDAGIGSAGNLFVAALQVTNADNISASGSVSGVPVADTGGIGASLAGVSNMANDASKSAEQATQMAGQGSSLPSFLTVEVIGVGE